MAQQQYTRLQGIVLGVERVHTAKPVQFRHSATVADMELLNDEYRALYKALEDGDMGRYEHVVERIQIMEQCLGIEVES